MGNVNVAIPAQVNATIVGTAQAVADSSRSATTFSGTTWDVGVGGTQTITNQFGASGDSASTLNGAVSAGASSFVVDDTTITGKGYAVVSAGVAGTAELVTISSDTSGTHNLSGTFANSHSDGANVVFLDERGEISAKWFGDKLAASVSAADTVNSGVVKLAAATTYSIGSISTITTTNGVKITGAKGSILNGAGSESNDLFNPKASLELHNVKISNWGGRVVDTGAAVANVADVVINNVFFDTCGSQLSGDNAVIHDSANSNGINRLTVTGCRFASCHGGLRIKGDNITRVTIRDCRFNALTASAISIGDNNGVHKTQYANVDGNTITTVTQATTSTEAHGIIVISEYANVTNNTIVDVRNSNSTGDDEPLYVKSLYGAVTGNVILDTVGCSSTNGLITVKGDNRGSVGGTDVLGYAVVVAHNRIFADTGTTTPGIGIFREDCIVSHNILDGVGDTGIETAESSELENIQIVGNTIRNHRGEEGIRVRGYTKNVIVSGNILDDCSNGTNQRAIYISNSSVSGTERLTVSGNQISGYSTDGVYFNLTNAISDVQIEGNQIDGATYGIRNGTTSVAINNHLVVHNQITGAGAVATAIEGFDTGSGHIANNPGYESRGRTFTDADTTPSIALRDGFFTAANTSGTTVTKFDDGALGYEIAVFFSNANTTLEHATVAGDDKIYLRGGSDVTPAANTLYKFRQVRIGSNDMWCEI